MSSYNGKICNLNGINGSGGYKSRYPATYGNSFQKDDNLPYNRSLSPGKYKNVDNPQNYVNTQSYINPQSYANSPVSNAQMINNNL